MHSCTSHKKDFSAIALGQAILGIGLFCGLYSEAYDRLWVKLILDNFSFPALGPLKPENWFGVINAIGLLFGVVAAEIVRRRLDTRSHRSIARLLLAASSGLTASLSVFALSGNLLLALGAVGNLVSVRAAIAAAALVLSPVLLLYNRTLRQQGEPAVIILEESTD